MGLPYQDDKPVCGSRTRPSSGRGPCAWCSRGEPNAHVHDSPGNSRRRGQGAVSVPPSLTPVRENTRHDMAAIGTVPRYGSE